MMRSFVWIVVCFVVLRGGFAGAQTRIPIRPEPKAGQTIHVTTTQKFSFSLDSGAEAGQAPAAQIVTETVLVYTQANGRFDEKGRMESQLTIESIEMKQALNGSPKATGAIDQLSGRSLTAVFDRGGKLVDISMPKDLQQAAAVKQLVAGAYGALNFLPASAMSVGETETAPSSIPLKLPGSTSTVPFQTRTVTTLRAIEKKGSDRVAQFDQRIESADKSGALQVGGTGTIDVNLDRGFIAASATEWNVSSEGAMTGTASGAPKGVVRGSIKITVAARE